MINLRGTTFAVAGLAASIAVATTAQAQSVADFYRGKTVKIVIGASVGGSYGFFAQLAARHISPYLPGNPTVVVQSMPGAGGNKAMNYTYNAAPQDGTVVSLVHLSVVQETLFNPKIRFDARGFQYIGRFKDSTLVATAAGRTGVKSLADVQKKQFVLGSSGRRNLTYLGPAVMNKMGGTKFKIISGYRGTRATYKALVQGELDVAITSWDTLSINFAEDLKTGKLVPLFTVAANRHPALPNIPAVVEFGKTAAEKGYLKIMTTANQIGRSMGAPPKMPKYLVDAWRSAFNKMVADKAFRNDVAKRRVSLNTLTGQELTKMIHETLDLPKATIDSARAIHREIVPGSK